MGTPPCTPSIPVTPVWLLAQECMCQVSHVPMSPTACRALVDELEWEIAQVDPRKTIQMGSFRINPDGSQSVVEVRPVPVSPLSVPLPGPR